MGHREVCLFEDSSFSPNEQRVLKRAISLHADSSKEKNSPYLQYVRVVLQKHTALWRRAPCYNGTNRLPPPPAAAAIRWRACVLTLFITCQHFNTANNSQHPLKHTRMNPVRMCVVSSATTMEHKGEPASQRASQSHIHTHIHMCVLCSVASPAGFIVVRTTRCCFYFVVRRAPVCFTATITTRMIIMRWMRMMMMMCQGRASVCLCASSSQHREKAFSPTLTDV